ncbi:MAG: hypothetical protein M1823_003325 [Watsoniomyces obsoletus]|nr:MAG: hypothetical protein M1823_003325 [Watsoniomyces obsoletus]
MPGGSITMTGSHVLVGQKHSIRPPSSSKGLDLISSTAPSLYPAEHGHVEPEELFIDLTHVADDPTTTSAVWAGYPAAVEEPQPIWTGHHHTYRSSWFEVSTSDGGLGIRGNHRSENLPLTNSAPSTGAHTPVIGLDPRDPLVTLPSSRPSPSDPLAYGRPVTLKRSREEESSVDSTPPVKQRRTSRLIPTPDLNEEERLLIQLKDEEYLPWKDIANRFHADLGKAYQVPALQMRYKRLREKLRPWTENDIHALEQAHDYWMRNKWDIIANKMPEFSCLEKWPGRYCARKWEELHPGQGHLKDMTASPGRMGDESDHESPALRHTPVGTPGLEPIGSL